MTPQTPTPVRCTVARRMVHIPLAVKETGNPDDAIALILKSRSPAVRSRRAAKRMVWSASLGHMAGGLASAEQTQSDERPRADHAAKVRLVAGSSAAPASRAPQPMPGVQSDP